MRDYDMVDSSAADLRVGLVGLGSLGVRLGRQFEAVPDAELAAIADVSEANLAEAGGELEVPSSNQFLDYETMLDEADLDAAAIATPNGLHYDQTVAALERDLHVLCEKPLATNLEDARDLYRRDRETDRVMMLGYQRHLNPAFINARQRWAEGDAEPTFITGEITHDWRSYYENMDDWRMDPELSGGGHLLNVGSHVIDAILWVTGLTPTHVNANVEFHDDEQLFDKQSSITIEFDNGAIANFSDTGIVACTREHIHIWDDDGAVYLEGREWDERTGYTIDAEGTEHDRHLDYHGRETKAEAFTESVLEGTEPPISVRDAFRTLVVTMAAYESGRADERIDLADRYSFVGDGLLD
ncbi:oxidoreductase domain protein (plasmid) [Haloterrigena turkmenica DSM 5511]|uniref:Oxidoreductase domain protein n=1 Tax=Haloterrigena turkmenica (strain ATCC 51198 / DSM 5511 / JCM 9101 / NCIMB 13204 / VKM B-1734 / 4k) TaxID=543526 RepID=D2S1I9_HALTV|nr:Gfo/Idh/MocA family oxidoreductase [Haloterrigena turkmenica]ADB63236.1 oxidoreductase domain protein [Haloterrigena turkmenica DSM 5511]